MLGDWFWYELGRLRGRSVLALLCRVSLEPDTCVRKTAAAFTKRGAGTLLFAKFVPAMSLVSMPLAGATRMPRWLFLLADAAGCSLWATTYLVLGFLFHNQVDSVIEWLGLFGRRAGLVVLIMLALYAGFKYLQRWRFRREMRINCIDPETLANLLTGSDPVTIVDLRHPHDIDSDGLKIPGALITRPDDLRSRSHEIPAGQEVILYCT
jgi:hypothetical protein